MVMVNISFSVVSKLKLRPNNLATPSYVGYVLRLASQLAELAYKLFLATFQRQCDVRTVS